MKKLVSIFILTLIISSCCEDDKLSLIREDIIDSPIKIDGVYIGNPSSINRNIIYSPSLVLYENGIVYQRYGGGDGFDWKSYIENHCHFKPDSKNDLGIWQVQGKNIQINIWYNDLHDLGEALYQGKIINDSTFVLKYRQSSVCGDETVEVIDDTYHFIRTDCKPDSTNSIIK